MIHLKMPKINGVDPRIFKVPKNPHQYVWSTWEHSVPSWFGCPECIYQVIKNYLKFAPRRTCCQFLTNNWSQLFNSEGNWMWKVDRRPQVLDMAEYGTKWGGRLSTSDHENLQLVAKGLRWGKSTCYLQEEAYSLGLSLHIWVAGVVVVVIEAISGLIWEYVLGPNEWLFWFNSPI